MRKDCEASARLAFAESQTKKTPELKKKKKKETKQKNNINKKKKETECILDCIVLQTLREMF